MPGSGKGFFFGGGGGWGRGEEVEEDLTFATVT